VLLLVATYRLLVLTTSQITDWVSLIVFLELLSWAFALLLDKWILKYLVVQSYFILLRIVGSIIRALLLLLRGLLKMGMPPFHGWLLPIIRIVRKEVFIFITTLHKLLPIMFLLLLVFIFNRRHLIILVLLSLRVLLLGASVRFVLIITFSSFVHSGWILLGALVRTGFVLFYWGTYLTLSFVLLRIKQNLLRQRVSHRVIQAAYWLILSGLPPFTIFWLKTQVVVRGASNLLLLILLLLFSLIISVGAYYRAYGITLLPAATGSNKYLIIPLIVLFFSLY